MTKLKIVSSRIAFKGRGINIVVHRARLPSGRVVDLESVVSGGDAVFVVAAINKKEIMLVKEWRPTWGKYITEIVGGGIKSGATMKERAAKAREELREELGFNCRHLKLLAHVMASPRTKMHYALYLATGLYKSPLPPDEGEYVEAVRVPLDKALSSALSGKREVTIQTLLGLLFAKEELRKR